MSYCNFGRWEACECMVQSCDDGNPCTNDTVSNFACVNTAVVGRVCNDSNACTSGDLCNAAKQCVGTAINLNDGNPCTKDLCSPASGPSHPPDTGAACNDGSVCTSGDSCTGSATCVGTPLSIPSDGNACTADSCNPVSGFQYTAQPGLSCNDQNACTSGDVCGASAQCAGTAINLDDSNVCTTDACSPATGPSHVLISFDDQNVCTADSYDPVLGPLHVPRAGSCNDGNACTISDACSAGTCVGSPLSIDDQNACTHDSCGPATGYVAHQSVGSSLVCTAATTFCYDRFGRVTRKIVCANGLPCDTPARDRGGPPGRERSPARARGAAGLTSTIGGKRPGREPSEWGCPRPRDARGAVAFIRGVQSGRYPRASFHPASSARTSAPAIADW